MPSQSTLLRARFGDFVADFESFQLRKHDTRLKLQHQPFLVLKLLVQSPGQLVTREQFCTELWAESTFVDFDAGLNAAIRRLREVLCESADQPRYIETLPRLGYRFIAPVEVLAETPAPVTLKNETTLEGLAEGLEAREVPSEVDVAGGMIGGAGRNLWTASLLACVLVVTLGLGAFTLRLKVFARRPGSTSIYSIAVLPLQNLSGDASQDYFAEGMTDALITNLAQSNSLRVISSTSSLRYKDPHKAIPEIGRELNVGLILEGSVIRFGNHVRVTTQLVDAAKDQHLWARQYDRDLQDILQLQSEVASAVVLEVTGKLTSLDQERSITMTRKVRPEAYEAFLKGEYFLNKWSEDGFDKAKTYFERAIDLDPDFPDAYAGLAQYYGTVAFNDSVPPREAWLKAEELLAKTLAMDPRSVRAHTLLGMLKLQFRCDPAGAKKELDYALELNPGDKYALDFHSYYLLEIGQTDQAIAEKRRVLEQDPLAVITNAELPLYLMQAGRTDEAILQLQKTLELDPNFAAAHMRLGFAYSKKEQYEQAALEMQKAIALDSKPARLANLGVMYAGWGKRGEALQVIARLQHMSKQRYVAPTMIAAIYSRLDDKTAALEWLEKAKSDDEPNISDDAFESLRSDPHFQVLQARLKPDLSCAF